MTDPRSARTGLRPLAVVFVVSVIAIAAIVFGVWRNFRAQLDPARESRRLVVQGTTRARAYRIQQWLDNRTIQIAEAADEVGASFADSIDSGDEAARARLRAWITRLVRTYHLASLRIADGQGTTLSAVKKSAAEVPPSVVRQAIHEATSSGKPVTRMVVLAAGGCHVLIVAPIAAREPSVRSGLVLVAELDAEETVFRLFAQEARPSRSWETLLIAVSEGVWVVLERPGPPPLRFRATAIPRRDVIAAHAVAGRVGNIYGLDYRGRRCSASIVPLSIPGWIVVGRESMEESERLGRLIFGPLTLTIVLVLVLALGAVYAVWITQAARDAARRLRAELEAVEKERSLAETRKFLETVLNTIPQRVFWKDRESRYLGCNIPFARDAGMASPEDLLGKDDYAMSWARNADDYRRDDREVMETGQPKIGYEEPQDHPDGTRLWLRTSKVPLRDPDGSIVGVLGTYEDITEQVEAREALEAAHGELAEKNRELSHLVSVASHELRAPLVTLGGFAMRLEMLASRLRDLLEDLELPEADRNALSILLEKEIPDSVRFIKEAVRGMERRVNGLLTVSRTHRTDMHWEPLDMQRLLGNLVEGLAAMIEEAGATVEVGVLPSCVGDSILLEQAFTNLLTNALKFRHPDRPCHVRITGQIQGKNAVYCVHDNGTGIPADKLEAVFDMFYRAAPDEVPGDGLGLSIVRTIVRRHGGRCWIESREGEWTRVYVALPQRGRQPGTREGGRAWKPLKQPS